MICSESLGNVLHFSLPVSPCILPSFFIHKKKSIVHLISLKTIIDIVSYLIFFYFFFFSVFQFNCNPYINDRVISLNDVEKNSIIIQGCRLNKVNNVFDS